MKRLSLVLGLASLLLTPACALPDLPVLSDGGGTNAPDTGTDDAPGIGSGDAASIEPGTDAATDATIEASAGDAGADGMAIVGAGAVGTLGAACPSSGALACAGNAQKLTIACTAGVWTTVMTCPQGQNCDSRLGMNQGTCAAIDPLCTTATPGGNVCSDTTTVVQCGPDLVSDSPVTTCMGQGCVNGACTGTCTPGTTQCSSTGNAVQTCGSDGTWGVAVDCSSTTCSRGVCSGSCSAGAKQCSGTSAVQSCVAGTWGTPVPCVNQACVAGAYSGRCSPSTMECTSDTQQVTCDTTGQWGTTPTTCAYACVGTLNTVPGSCGGVCVPGTTECTSDTQQATCGTNGQWDPATTCAYACVGAVDTVGGTCGGVCVPGTTECTSDTQLATCGTGGQWESPAATCTYACLGTLNTVPGACGGTCVPNSTQCTGSTAYETCGPLGTWVATSPCTASAPYCSISNGTCGPPPNVIFVTSTFVNGNLGGLAGADATCQAAAQGASLTGTFIAYLSTSTISAASRVQNARGWVRTDGLPVADTGAALAAGSLFYPIALDQKGNPTTTTNSWQATGTTYQGVVYSGDTCGDWISSAAGSSASAGSPWAGYSGFENYFYLSCSQSFRLVCLQVSQNVQVSVNKMAGRYAFVESGWSPATGGIAVADATCQSAATGASLPGTYSALLATSTASAVSRFSTTGSTWIRPDGLPVFATASDLNTMTVVTPIVLNASGGYQGNYALWSGAATPTTAGTLASTCDNWASNSADGGVPPATAGVTGFTQAPGSGGSAWGYTTLPCSATYGTVYCLQQ